MPFRDCLQTNRFEYKYLIDEAQAHAIRAYIKRLLVPDPYARSAADCRYFVHSLYCDSPALSLYWATQHGLKNRFKLRVRFYDDEPGHPAFFEIKRRVSGVIIKSRCMLPKPTARRLLFGSASPAEVINEAPDQRQFAALQEFWNLYQTLSARPIAYVSYTREAYVHPTSNDVRLTFDRGLMAGAHDPARCLHVPEKQRRAELPRVLLELKFTDRYPQWMAPLAASLNLHRISFAKYCCCLDALCAGRPVEGRFFQEVA